MKAFLDRGGVVVAVNPGIMRHKVGVAVAAVRRAWDIIAVDTINHFFLSKEMIVADSTYWNIVYGNTIESVLNNEEGMGNIRNLGSNIAWLTKRIHME